MNTVQLAERLGRHLRVDDPANLPAPAALDVVTAINAGVQAYYRELPAIYRRSTMSHTLRAPREVEIEIGEQYGNALTEDTFDPDMRGCTVRLPGQPHDNLIVSEDALLDDYLGTELEMTATVYGDAVPLEDVIEKIVSEVRLYSGRNPGRWTLMRDEQLRERACRLATVGTPRWYCIDPLGPSQGGEPHAMLRVSPLPDADYVLRFEALLGARRISFVNLSVPVNVPVPEARVEDLLLPLCEAELTLSPFWREEGEKGAFLDKAAQVLGRRLPMVAGDIGAPFHRVGAPRGF